MGFLVPHKTKVNPSTYSILYRQAWDLYGDEVVRLQELGVAAAERGKDSIASKYYRGANIYFYITYLLLAAYEKQKLLNSLGELCTGSVLEDCYKLTCVREKLVCLSVDFDTDYKSVWDELINQFGIDTYIGDDCEGDCTCVGVGQMIIEGDNDCTANIVASCAEVEN